MDKYEEMKICSFLAFLSTERICLYCDFVYTRSNVLTGCVNDGVSIGASLQIVSIIKTHADSV